MLDHIVSKNIDKKCKMSDSRMQHGCQFSLLGTKCYCKNQQAGDELFQASSGLASELTLFLSLTLNLHGLFFLKLPYIY